MRDVTFSRRDMLLAGGALAVGAFAEPLQSAAAEPAAAGAEPTSWVDPAMPEVKHRMIETNGIRLHIAEQGDGPLVILCHGFPECWYSWRHQLGALAKAGFRAVAPDLRGYGRSDRPEDVEKYTILHDIGDVVNLIDALGAKQAVIAGHDIGATVAWQAALLRPDRFRGVIAMSPPFRPRAFGASSVPPTTLMPKNETAVFYQLFLQTPEAEAGLGRDLRRTFRSQFYQLSGDRPPAAPGGLPAGMVPRKGALIDPPSLPAWITEADLNVYVEAYTQSGWHGPLAWWRNIDRGWELMAPFDGATVSVPALYMAGDRDMVVAAFREAIPKQTAFVPKLRPPLMLAGCGHWTQQERPTEVSAAMIEFIRSL
jgi:pimeloyl-ACP methyl ester carboxylesterase